MQTNDTFAPRALPQVRAVDFVRAIIANPKALALMKLLMSGGGEVPRPDREGGYGSVLLGLFKEMDANGNGELECEHLEPLLPHAAA